MKKIVLLVAILLIGVVACTNEQNSGGGSNYTELEVATTSVSPKRITGTIATDGEVDLYRVQLTDYNRNIQIKCTQKLEDDDDLSGNQQELTLLVQIYAEDANGDLRMVAGDHANEGSGLPADIKIPVFIDQPKYLYIHVRDLMDDDSSNRPYYISAMYEAPEDGNDSLGATDTITLTINGDGVTDEIGSVGDVDFFKFTVATAGVYDISVNYTESLSAGLELAMDLIELDGGSTMDHRSIENTGTVHMIHYLEAGDYAVGLDDEGQDDFSPSSRYTIAVNAATVAEEGTNDDPAVASGAMQAETTAAIEYFGDEDWYPVDQAVGTDISVLEMAFTPGDTISYQVSVFELDDPAGYDPEVDTPIFVRNVLSSYGNLQTTIKLDREMDYFVRITAASGSSVDEAKAYTLALVTDDVDDDADEGESDNNLMSTTIEDQEIDQSVPTNGKIAYRGDVDWYYFTVPAVDNQILSVYLDVPATPVAQYAFDICDNDGSLIKRVKTPSSARNAVDLKTGIQVASGATYTIKVYDNQNNDSDDSVYTLTWNVGVAVDPGDFPGGGTADYYSELVESANTGTQATIEYPSEEGNGVTKMGTFNVNMAMSVNDTETMTSAAGDGYTQYTSNWMTGYVDYQGDEDWFGLDLSAPPTGATLGDDGTWYYTIDLELYSADSTVEFSLEYLPDSDGNLALNSRHCWGDSTVCNGVQASIADGTPDVFENPLEKSILSDNFFGGPNAASCIWLGSGHPNPSDAWEGPVFFRIRDFYYMDLSGNVINPNPDNDWSVTEPYFFRVTVKFYTGSSHPPIN